MQENCHQGFGISEIVLGNLEPRYVNLPLKDLVQYVVKRSGKEIIHHAEIVVRDIFDVGVAELSRTMA